MGVSDARWLVTDLAGDVVQLVDVRAAAVVATFDVTAAGRRSPLAEAAGRVALSRLVPLGDGRVASVQGGMRIGSIAILDTRTGTVTQRFEVPRCAR